MTKNKKMLYEILMIVLLIILAVAIKIYIKTTAPSPTPPPAEEYAKPDTNPKDEIICDWCGRTCVEYPISKEDCEKAKGFFDSQCACPQVMPPEYLSCGKANGKCVQSPKQKF